MRARRKLTVRRKSIRGYIIDLTTILISWDLIPLRTLRNRVESMSEFSLPKDKRLTFTHYFPSFSGWGWLPEELTAHCTWSFSMSLAPGALERAIRKMCSRHLRGSGGCGGTVSTSAAEIKRKWRGFSKSICCGLRLTPFRAILFAYSNNHFLTNSLSHDQLIINFQRS